MIYNVFISVFVYNYFYILVVNKFYKIDCNYLLLKCKFIMINLQLKLKIKIKPIN